MKINIKKTTDMTPSLQTYIESKLMPLAKFIQHWDEKGDVEIWLEVSRTTNHHRKGDVFMAAADLKLPGKILRGEASAEDIRTAIDEARNMLHMEIEKYKTRTVKSVRRTKREK